VIDARLSRMKPGETLEGSARLGLVRTRPAPPRWAFFSGVFSFPFYAGSWSRWVGLSMAASVALGLLGIAVLLMAGPGMGYFSAVPWVIGMLFFAFAGFVGLAWAAVASVFLLAILQDTAAGNDEVEDWPSAMFTDWILECVYVLNAFTLSVLPGVAITQALGFHNPASWMAVPAAGFVLFPLVLLSMLEADSAVKPFSLPVWRSLFGMGWAWGLFYAEAVVLVVAFFLLSGLALLLPWPLAIPLVATVLVAALMIYFRLIGRLAWCCADRAAEEEARERRLLHEVEAPRA